MKYLFILFALITTLSLKAQTEFITQWTFPNATTIIRFNALTVGGPVDYTWSASPSGNSGNGNFTRSGDGGAVTLGGLTIAAGDVVTLSMTPTNLRRFSINNGPDRGRLTDVTQWGSVPWRYLNFKGCRNLQISATDVPDLSEVTSMFEMFMDCTYLIGPSNINSWNTASVTNMRCMFKDARQFNENIGNWNTAAVTNMYQMFSNARTFNQDIGNWNTASVTNMIEMFSNARTFNQDIGNWNTALVPDMNQMFYLALEFNGNISNWNTASVTNMREMFLGAAAFNQDIGNWNTASVTTMHQMFRKATSFNQDIGNWNTAAVTDMRGMFDEATLFNGQIGNWNTISVLDMSEMFRYATSFNQYIGNWNTVAVTSMYQMFLGATAFNQDIGNWNTAAVTDMNYLFTEASSFNGDLGNWNTAAVTSMYAMFWGATAFNQDIGNWNTSAVIVMQGMFNQATSFNQDIGNWNTAAVTDMYAMFNQATSFNQDIGSWTLNNWVQMNSMLLNSGMDCENYSATLIGWDANNPAVTHRYLGAATGFQYGTNAVLARNNLTENKGWVIFGDSPSGENCSPPVVVQDLVLHAINLQHGESFCYDATQTITATNFTVENGASAVFIAGQSITFGTGFVVQSGGNLHASITLTQEFCNQTSLASSSEITDRQSVSEPENKTAIAKDSFFKLFPNPTTGLFKLELSEITSTIIVEVYGLMGKQILWQEVTGHQPFEFDLSLQPRGIYIVRVLNGDAIESQRIIRQ
jgi:surface protein